MSARPTRRLAVGVLAALAAVGLLPGCATPTTSGAHQGSRQICAGDVSIAKVQVTIVAAPASGTVRLLREDYHPASGEGSGIRLGLLEGPLTPGATYTLAQSTQGLVDLGLCMELQASAGVVYRYTVTPVSDPQVILLYALSGGHLSPGYVRGVPKSSPQPPPTGPTEVEGLSDVSDLEIGYHACALVSGAVKCWGRNVAGGLGDGTAASSSTPVDVVGITDAAQVTVGGYTSCALLASGEVKCWGLNFHGSLGNGTSDTDSSVPVSVLGIDDAVRISSSYTHSCAIVAGGAVKCWGGYMLGDGTSQSSNVPVDVIGVSDAIDISAGYGHTCALISDGTVKCWGENADGELGDGTNEPRYTAVDVVGLTDAVALASGEHYHTCAVTAGGGVKCWGNGSTGQLGDGAFGQSNVPIDVPGAAGTVDLDAHNSTCNVGGSGAVRCWGPNASGEAGDGTRFPLGVPVTVEGLPAITKVAVGSSVTCAVTTEGSVHCWGDDELITGA